MDPSAASAAAAAPSADSQVQHGYVRIHCPSCRLANEVAIPVGDEREFTVQCYHCKEHATLSIDTHGDPLNIAEGQPEWSNPPPELEPLVPPKKRKKPAAPSSEDATEEAADSASAEAPPDDDDDVEDMDESDEEEVRPLSARTGKAAAPAAAKKLAAANKKAAAKAAAAAPPAPAPPKLTGKKGASSAAAASGAASASFAKKPSADTAAHAKVKKSKSLDSNPPKEEELYIRPAMVKLGSVVLALFHDGYYYTGVVEGIQVSERSHSSKAAAYCCSTVFKRGERRGLCGAARASERACMHVRASVHAYASVRMRAPRCSWLPQRQHAPEPTLTHTLSLRPALLFGSVHACRRASSVPPRSHPPRRARPPKPPPRPPPPGHPS